MIKKYFKLGRKFIIYENKYFDETSITNDEQYQFNAFIDITRFIYLTIQEFYPKYFKKLSGQM
jgi:hypothetical protein